MLEIVGVMNLDYTDSFCRKKNFDLLGMCVCVCALISKLGLGIAPRKQAVRQNYHRILLPTLPGGSTADLFDSTFKEPGFDFVA